MSSFGISPMGSRTDNLDFRLRLWLHWLQPDAEAPGHCRSVCNLMAVSAVLHPLRPWAYACVATKIKTMLEHGRTQQNEHGFRFWVVSRVQGPNSSAGIGDTSLTCISTLGKELCHVIVRGFKTAIGKLCIYPQHFVQNLHGTTINLWKFPVFIELFFPPSISLCSPYCLPMFCSPYYLRLFCKIVSLCSFSLFSLYLLHIVCLCSPYFLHSVSLFSLLHLPLFSLLSPQFILYPYFIHRFSLVRFKKIFPRCIVPVRGPAWHSEISRLCSAEESACRRYHSYIYL